MLHVVLEQSIKGTASYSPYNNMLLQSLSQREHKGHICVGEPNLFTQVFVISVSKNHRSKVIPLLLLN